MRVVPGRALGAMILSLVAFGISAQTVQRTNPNDKKDEKQVLPRAKALKFILV